MHHAARSLSTLLAVVLAASGLAACGSDKPAVCDDVDTLQSSVDNLKDIQVSENGVNELSTQLTQIKQDLKQLGTDAKAEFGDDVSKVETAMTSLQSSVAAAKSERTASSLSAVGTAIEGVTSSMSAMQDAVSGTC
jgi:hypothetical protein